MAGMEMKALAKSYGSHLVLSGVDLTVDDGEFIVLVGPSGCGKSTLLRMIAGLEPITAGEFAIGGMRMNEVAPRDRDIAMVFQSYALYPHMDVARNMGFSLEIRGRSKAEREQPVRDAAATLGLGALLERLPKALSGGQRQRVAMGRAIVRKPQAFLFDEPLSNLDAALRVEMRLEIARLHQRLGATMIYVTHDQVEAMTLADRIVVMNGGVIQQVGTPMDLYDRPANRFVAQFIGSPTMNILPVAVSDRGPVLANGVAPGLASGTAALGIRPEHLAMTAPGEGDFDVEVQVVERLGSDTNVFAEAEALGAVLARVHGNADVRPGHSVGLRLDRARMHQFDEAGERLG
ncbi:MAG: sn-glycerol-3-phosphate ABC transporter ATP-binding protein UgpC [Brucellaceae bacterium]|nr:sn-glycerol-3-phosphate ABC transporter ATP-binding protein UgpC [Brucellaceae bacterium]